MSEPRDPWAGRARLVLVMAPEGFAEAAAFVDGKWLARVVSLEHLAGKMTTRIVLDVPNRLVSMAAAKPENDPS